MYSELLSQNVNNFNINQAVNNNPFFLSFLRCACGRQESCFFIPKRLKKYSIKSKVRLYIRKL